MFECWFNKINIDKIFLYNCHTFSVYYTYYILLHVYIFKYEYFIVRNFRANIL